MGVDTKLYISHRFNLQDVMDVIQYHVIPNLFNNEGEVKFVPGHDECGYITFGNQNNRHRSMFYYPKSKTPLGTAIYLSLGHDEQAIKIMTCIAKVLGGLVQEVDNNDNMKMYNGRLIEEDGLSYFLKYSVIHDCNDGKDLDELKETIKKWEEKYRQKRGGKENA